MKHSSADAGRFRVVRVFDGSMNEQVPTYPKRAKGLIKNGRAKWLSEDSIVLIGNISSAGTASDVNFNDTEDKTMSELIYKDFTIDSLLARLESLSGALVDSNDIDLAGIIGNLYTETINVVKDVAKQNQEIKLAQLKAAK